MTEPPKPASRSPWACWGCISGLIFFLVLVFTGGYFWLLRYYEQDAYDQLSAKERVEFQTWLQEPIDYPHEMLVARPPKSDYVVSQETRHWAELRRAYDQVRQLPKVTTQNRTERATSITALLGPPLKALAHLGTSANYVLNRRTPTGTGTPVYKENELIYSISYYVASLITLNQHVEAADVLTNLAHWLRHDPGCGFSCLFSADLLELWTDVVDATTDTTALRRHYAAIQESSGTLTDVHSEISFFVRDINHLPRLMLEHGYADAKPTTRQDYLQMEVEEDKFYWHLRRTLPEGNKLKRYLVNERKGNARYHFDFRIPPPLMRLQIGPLKTAFKNLALAHKLKHYAWRFESDRDSKAMEPQLIQGYSDLASSITLRLAEAEGGFL